MSERGSLSSRHCGQGGWNEETTSSLRSNRAARPCPEHRPCGIAGRRAIISVGHDPHHRRDCRRHAAGHRRPHHRQRARRDRRLARRRREQARRDPDHWGRRSPQAAGGRPNDPVDRAPFFGGTRAAPQRRLSAGCRFCPGHQARERLSRAGRSSVRAGELAVRACRAAQTGARQAHLLVRRLRHARASGGRDVQAADRRARELMCPTRRFRALSATCSMARITTSSSRRCPSSSWSIPASCVRSR